MSKMVGRGGGGGGVPVEHDVTLGGCMCIRDGRVPGAGDQKCRFFA